VSETADRYRRIATGFTSRLAEVTAEQWTSPTPCSDWAVRDLVAHVIGIQRGVIARLDGTESVAVETEGDLPEQWREASRALGDALDDKARASRVVGGMFGEQSFESLVGRMVCADLLVHSWDLARATGQDESLDPGSVSKAQEFLVPLGEKIRAPGGFAAQIEPSAEADDQTRFLNFCGRAG